VLGGEAIDVTGADGTPPVRADGTLAGSALRMDRAIANMVAVGIALPDAVAAATRIPADLIRRPDIGRIEAAAAADLTWLNDELTTTATWVSGSQVYTSSLG
jgi:N-acetylglucosamine-6-phosphate deacetylase